MNPFVRKEVRLLLPSFAVGLLPALLVFIMGVSILLHHGVAGFGIQANGLETSLTILSFYLCPIIAVILALDSFGREISGGTFANLIAQPIHRLRVWRTKTSILAISIFLIWAVWLLNNWLTQNNDQDLNKLLSYSPLVALAIYSGGLWTVLLIRQVAAAFWFTILIPATFIVLIETFLHYHPYAAGLVAIAVFSIYSLSGFLFARWLFLQAQDAQWTGGTITLPEMRGLARWQIFSGTHRAWRPRVALFIKELQFHQSQYVMAVALAVLHLGMRIVWHFSTVKKNSALELLLENFWVLWLVIPFLIGAAAVAEERKMGTLDAQLCLPVPARTQFRIKLFTVVALSLFFGAFLPVLLEGTRILPGVHIHLLGTEQHEYSPQAAYWTSLQDWIDSWLPSVCLPAIAVTIGLLAFYASTLCRNVLQAFMPGAVMISLAVFLLANAWHPELIMAFPPWHGALIYLFGLPVAVIVLRVLALQNFRRVWVHRHVWQRNLFVLSLSLIAVMALTTIIYNRPWEFFSAMQTRTGPARLDPAAPVTIKWTYNSFAVQLPDHRVWIDDQDSPDTTHTLGGSFLKETNWLSWATDWHIGQLIVVKDDGSLWLSQKPAYHGIMRYARAESLTQFGHETNWQSVATFWVSPLLLKKDGSLWQWNTTNLSTSHTNWHGLQTRVPEQIGIGSDWSEISWINSGLHLRRKDGTVWTSGYWDFQTNDGQIDLKLPGAQALTRVTSLETNRYISIATVGYDEDYLSGVRSDGTFRIWAHRQVDPISRIARWAPTDRQLGTESDWRAVVSYGDKILTLRNDGSLWLWNFNYHSGWGSANDRVELEMAHTVPVRFNKNSDWITLTEHNNRIVGLSADGSLWYWDFPGDTRYYHNFSYNGYVIEPPRLLRVSRQPHKLANLFDTPDILATKK